MSTHHATIVADLGFGDAGKGTTIDYLARRGNATVVRFNGGAQAAHNVVTPDGKHHKFSQFGSGMFVPGVRTHLSRFMLFDPIALIEEARLLRKVGCEYSLLRLTVDRDAIVVTPFHKAANRLREKLRGDAPHGTCGMGIGETMADSLTADDTVFVSDLRDVPTLTKKFRSIQMRKRAEFSSLMLDQKDPVVIEELCTLEDSDFSTEIAQKLGHFARLLLIVTGDYLARAAKAGELLFEGAQGVLLDERYGFFPYITRSTTTFENALTLLAEIGYEEEVTKLGVLRAYHTRHGAGPLVTHDKVLSAALPDLHNGAEGWQGEFRVGWFDFVMARYAQSVAQADSLVITHLDRYATIENPQACMAYVSQNELIKTLPLKTDRDDMRHQAWLEQLLSAAEPIYKPAPTKTEEYLQLIEQELGVPVTIESHGTSALDKRLRISN